MTVVKYLLYRVLHCGFTEPVCSYVLAPQEAVGLTEASGWRDVGAQSGRSGARRHLQGLAVQVDQLHQGIPAAMVRPEQRPAVLLQVQTL